MYKSQVHRFFEILNTHDWTLELDFTSWQNLKMPCSNFVLIILHTLFSFLYSAWWQAAKCTQDVACQVNFICQPSAVQQAFNYPVCMVLCNDIVHTTYTPAIVKMIVGIIITAMKEHSRIAMSSLVLSSQLFYCGCQVVLKHSWVFLHVHAFIHRFLLLLPTSFHLGSWVSTTWLWTPSLSVQVSLTSMLHARPAGN